ncbi:DoxX family protein [Pedobacter foliorum]|uniref:DoxX family protein n=1 Tax=Pedobacter foliorum TaxID=2739058 RepID=UPI001564E7D1|nr:DoxX family protein [Pedobacter foliorum]NRF39525.1 DoxX family protein [Pedobacter foliorum]
MTSIKTEQSADHWKGYEKLIFRFLFIYFLLQTIPLDWRYYRGIFSINWLDLKYGDIFFISRYFPSFSTTGSFTEWFIIAIVAAIGTVLWTIREKKEANYDVLHYWLRTILRYRLAIGVIGYGFLKFFPLQAPFPSISNLNTNYGDFTDWKLFSLSLGVVPNYESFLGAVELLAGFLLFFRRTASVGALIILVFTGNVFMSNLAYGGGEYVYSLYLISLALFIFAYDAGRIYRLIALGKPTHPNLFHPSFLGWQAKARIVVKVLLVFFFVAVYGFKTYEGFKYDPYQFPKQDGLADAAGIYNVKEFKINNEIHPYSASDSIRWKDVVFEKWATISIRSKRPVILDSINYEQIVSRDVDRNYELSGSGGRHYYSYKVDTLKHVLFLENKNKNYRNEKLTLNFSRPDSVSIVLSGVNENKDSIYVLLEKLDKKYPIKLGRRGRLKL